MAKIIVSLDGNIAKVIPLDKDRLTLGRRPYNDIVLDNLAVSGEHAALQVIGKDFFIEDLNSTNGTSINDQRIKRQILKNGDTVLIGKFTLNYVQDGNNALVTWLAEDGLDGNKSENEMESVKHQLFERTKFAEAYVAIKILSGASTGKELPLVKIVTTIGKPGEAVIAITKRSKSYMAVHVEGTVRPTLNGVTFGIESVPLRNGDLLELAGTAMQFIQN